MEKEKHIVQKPIVMVMLALLSTALWGSASPAIKISYDLFRIGADDMYSKCLIAGIRFIIAGAIVIIYEMIKNRKIAFPEAKEFPKLLGLGAVQTALQYLLFYSGLAYTTGGKGALFSSIDGFFIVLFTPLFFKGQKLTVSKIFGCIVGFAGLVLTSVGTDISKLAGFSIRGEGFVALSALCFATSFFYAKKLMKRMSPATVTGWNMVLGASILIVVGLIGGGKIYWGNGWKAILVLTYLCLLSSVAYTVWSLLMKYNPVNKVSILKLFTPIFGAIWSALLLNEAFTFINLVALALVCCGIWVINREP